MYGFKIYIDPKDSLETTLAFLKNPTVIKNLRDIHLSKGESLHIGFGYATLYLFRFDCDEVLTTMSVIISLLETIPKVKKEMDNYDDLSERFQKLVPLIRRWGILDDPDRMERIQKASSSTLGNLINFVEPEFDLINIFLDSYKNNPLPYSAILLGALAECATEAKIILQERKN